MTVLVLFFLFTLDTGQFQEIGRRNFSWVENYNPTTTMDTQSSFASELNYSKNNDTHHDGQGLTNDTDLNMPTPVLLTVRFSEVPESTQSEIITKGAVSGAVTSEDTSNVNSILPEPSLTDQSASRTHANPTESLVSGSHSLPPRQSVTYASPFHISKSLESDLLSNSQTQMDVMSFNAESFSSEETVQSHHAHHFSRFPHHSISTLSLDIISLVTTIISSQPLISTAQTPTSHPDVSMTTADMSDSITAGSVHNDFTWPDNITPSPADTAAEDVHNTSNIRMSTVLPRLLSAATQVDSSLPSGSGLENSTLAGATPGEKSTQLTEGSIVGIVLGCIAAIVAFSLLMLCFCYKQKKMGTLSPKKKKKTGHYTGLFDDGITLSYINCQFEPTKDPIEDMASLDNDAYLNSLEQYMVNQTWLTNTANTSNTNL